MSRPFRGHGDHLDFTDPRNKLGSGRLSLCVWFPATAEQNLVKLNRKQDFNILLQVFFRADRKTNMVALVSDLLIHFRLFILVFRSTQNTNLVTDDDISFPSSFFECLSAVAEEKSKTHRAPGRPSMFSDRSKKQTW